MKENLKSHKEEFQIERIAFFSDAVFAIAITLLIIEIKVPEIHEKPSPTDEEFMNYFLTVMLQKFLGLFLSFFVIGVYWMVNHRMFKYVIHYNRKLVWNNLLFLLSIVLMPFSSALLSEYFIFKAHTPLAFYTLNICFTGYMSYRLWKIVGNPKYHLSEGLDNKALLKFNVVRAFAIPIIFLVIFLLTFINHWIAAFILPAVPIVSYLINKYFKKKYPEIMKEHLL